MTLEVYQYATRVYEGSVLRQWWDDTTATYHEYDKTGAETLTRPYTVDENAAATARAAAALARANAATLTGTTSLQGRLDRLALYKTDVDLTAVLAQTNNQALATATLNRALKTMIRREERLTATVALLVRLIDPALLANITDTADA